MRLFHVCGLNLALAKCVREAAPKTKTLHLPSQKRAVLLKLQVPCPTDLPPASPLVALGVSAVSWCSVLAENCTKCWCSDRHYRLIYVLLAINLVGRTQCISGEP